MHHTRSQSATNAAAAAQAAPPSEQQQQQQQCAPQATKPQPAVAATPSPRPPKHARHPSAAAAASSTATATTGGGAGGGAGASAGMAAAVQVEAAPAARGGGAVSNSVAIDATSAQAMPSSTSSSTSSSSGSADPSDVTDVEAMLAKLTSEVIANMKYKPQHGTLTTAHLERAVEVFKACLAAQEAALLPLGPDFLDFMGMPALQLTTGTTNLLANSDVLNSKAVPGVKVIEDADGLWLISLPGRPHAHAKAAIAGQFGAFAGARTVFNCGGGHWPSSVGPNTRDPDAAISRLFDAPGAAAPTVLAIDPIVIFEQEEKNRTISDLRKLVDEYFLNPCVEVVIVSKLFHNHTGSHRCGVVMYERTVTAGAAGTYAVTAQLDIGPTPLTGLAKQLWAAPTLGPPTLSVPQGAWVAWTSTLHPGAVPRVTWATARPAGMPQPPATTAPILAGRLAVDANYPDANITLATGAAFAGISGMAAHCHAAWATSPTLTIPRARLVSNVADAHGQLASHASFAGLTLNVGHMLNACMLVM